MVQFQPSLAKGKEYRSWLRLRDRHRQPYEPVIIEGNAELIDDLSAIRRFVAAVNQKYRTDYGVEFFTRAENACFRVRPMWAFGLMESDFTGSPTRWTFSP